MARSAAVSDASGADARLGAALRAARPAAWTSSVTVSWLTAADHPKLSPHLHEGAR